MGHLDCDDGNGIDTDGCSNAGLITAGYYCEIGSIGTTDVCPEICGDGIDNGNYGCDDGNNIPFDGCDEFCNLEAGWTSDGIGGFFDGCGDGGGNLWACDDGNNLNGDGCTDLCIVE